MSGHSHRYRKDAGRRISPGVSGGDPFAGQKTRHQCSGCFQKYSGTSEELKEKIIPEDVAVAVTRNYGYNAQEKVNNLLASLGFAVFTVVVLLAFSLGRREALVVAVAVPVSFSLALFVNYLFGYTINRVTLFALILSSGWWWMTLSPMWIISSATFSWAGRKAALCHAFCGE
ncbi:MAG: efflux RND transporter permease subunit [Desulfobacterales bacterium]